MQMVAIDSTQCSSTDDIHNLLQRELRLPGYYGKNLDALWDCLTGYIELPLTIEWRGFAKSRALIGAHVDKILKTLRDAKGITVLLR